MQLRIHSWQPRSTLIRCVTSNAHQSKNRTQFEVDPLNRVTKLIDALNGQTQLAYDPNGNVLTASESHVTTYTYNNMDRIAPDRRPYAL